VFRTICACGQVKHIFKTSLSTISLMFVTVAAAETLRQPSICTTIEAGASALQFPFCRVTPMADKPGQHELTLSLSATTSPVNVGGYRLSETDNYNGGYLPPIVELKPGDRFKVRLLNTLGPSTTSAALHGTADHGDGNKSTNLHTHGLIVSPRNARPELPQNGDNIFVSLNRGDGLDYSIDIPTALPASLLDGKSGIIPHPSGPFWYHSHQHGISAAQVGGGMSGLLSVGPRDGNLVATNPDETGALRARADTSYLMLRDIQITSATDPIVADGNSPAVWVNNPDSKLCEPGTDGVIAPPVERREGYCQSPIDKSKIWLFTVNGQRFPTIKIPSGRNNLWRVANQSANATYVISLLATSGAPVPFDLVSVDGVVPGIPVASAAVPANSPEAIKVLNIRLLPAARAEIFIENDNGDVTERRLILRTEGLNTAAPGEMAGDRWPEIKLAEVILEGATVVAANTARLGLNVPVTRPAPPTAASATAAAVPMLPTGCARDINKAELEHRRISFAGFPGAWKITTELVHPKDKLQLQKPGDFVPDPNATIKRVRFEQYLKPDHTVDWDGVGDGTDPGVRPRHSCVSLRNGHGQLWELNNPTAELHNFHLHQTKFRLAREQDLRDYGIDPGGLSLIASVAIKALLVNAGDERDIWHDTLPVEPGVPIFIVINFDAEEQLGRYVFHCHILKHEDDGLMAPIEVIR